MEVYSPQSQTWSNLTNIPGETGLRALSAVIQPDGIYILGGYDGASYVNTVSRYDTHEQEWKKMPPMNTARGTFVAVSSRNFNYIYAIGGFNGSPMAHVERWDAMSNSWEYLSPMHNKRFMHAAVLASIERNK